MRCENIKWQNTKNQEDTTVPDILWRGTCGGNEPTRGGGRRRRWWEKDGWGCRWSLGRILVWGRVSIGSEGSSGEDPSCRVLELVELLEGLVTNTLEERVTVGHVEAGGEMGVGKYPPTDTALCDITQDRFLLSPPPPPWPPSLFLLHLLPPCYPRLVWSELTSCFPSPPPLPLLPPLPLYLHSPTPNTTPSSSWSGLGWQTLTPCIRSPSYRAARNVFSYILEPPQNIYSRSKSYI